MGAGRDEAHSALFLAAGVVVGADGQQAGELTLAAGIWLQAHRVVAGDGDEHCLELADHLSVALGLVVGGVGVDVGELGPCDRLHLGDGVELHRARAEWDHRAIQRQILVRQAAQVAQHFVLGVEGVEHVLGKEGVGASIGQPVGHGLGRPTGGEETVGAEQGEYRSDGGERRRLVEAEAHVGIVDRA